MQTLLKTLQFKIRKVATPFIMLRPVVTEDQSPTMDWDGGYFTDNQQREKRSVRKV